MQKTAIVTGASSGIGLALSNKLLHDERNMRVIAICRDSTALQRLKEKYNERLVIITIDLTAKNAIDCIQASLEAIPRIDYLVHCAGVVTPLRRLDKLTYQQWQTIQQLNSDVPVFLSLACLNKFEQSRVMFLTSDQPVLPVKGAAAYCVSKAALSMACACLRVEVEEKRAVFATVAPGNVDTPMQARIRDTDVDTLPAVKTLIAMHESNMLLPPHLVAEYLHQLLFRVDSQTFGHTDWNIYQSVDSMQPTILTTNSAAKQAAQTRSKTITAFKKGLRGTVFLPGSTQFNEQRRVFNRTISRIPTAIVTPQTNQEIMKTIQFARDLNLPIAVQGGGHSVIGSGIIAEGIVLNMSAYNDILLNDDRSEVTVGAGIKNRQLDHFLAPYNLAIPLGTCPDVGVVGATLGGGLGFLSRKYGLSCDNVVQYELITADSRCLVVSASQHADLFWALRGGGGSQFGIVTHITFRLHRVPQKVQSGIFNWPISQAKDVLKAYSQTTLHGPTNQFLYAYFKRSERASATISVMGFSEILQGGLDDISSWSKNGIADVKQQTYFDCQSNDYETNLSIHWRNGIIEGDLSDLFIDTLLECYQHCPSNSGGIMLDPLCGAIQNICPVDSAFVHRRASFVCSITGVSETDHVPAEIVAWVEQTYRRLTPFFNGHAYQNYEFQCDDELRRYFGVNAPRLIELKRQFDPELRFSGSLRRYICRN